MSNEIVFRNTNLPSKLDELSDFISVGNGAVTAKRAQLRAMEKLGIANEDRLRALKEAQDLADAVLDAEVILGRLISEMTVEPGKRTDMKPGSADGTRLSKKEAIEQIGISKTQAHRYELLAAHPEIVEQTKSEARDTGEIVNQTAVLRAISELKKPFITNNGGNTEWYTPSKYIESARKVMGSIDLDPASCASANEIVKADRYFSVEDNGLMHEWTGNIWLNPPYAIVHKFIDKLLDSNIEQAIILVNNATETQWMCRLAEKAAAMVFHSGRLAFVKAGEESEERSKPMQGQIFIYIGPDPDAFLSEFSKYGWGAKPTGCT